jgi:radical SAM protein with 4Fe4S-binding SPASM domain
MKTGDLDNLRDKIYSGGGPFRVMCELTYRCSFNCGHCYVPQKYRRIYASKELTVRQYSRLFKGMADSGVFFVGFTGGEPLLRKDFFQIAQSARKQGLQIIVYSNGYLIDKNNAGRLADIGLNKMEITLPALDDSIFKKITGVKGLAKVLNAVGFLLKCKIPLALKTCALEANRGQVSLIADFCDKQGIEYKPDFFIAPRLDGSLIEAEQFTPGVRYELGCREHPGSELSLIMDSQVFPCGSGKTQCAVTPDGRLKACVQLAWPLVKAFDNNWQEKFLSAWNKLKLKTMAIENNIKLPCLKCGLKAKCLWCPGYTWAKTKNFMPAGSPPECAMFLNARMLNTRC